MMKACHVLSTAVTIKINDAEYDQIQIMEKAGRETEKEQKTDAGEIHPRRLFSILSDNKIKDRYGSRRNLRR